MGSRRHAALTVALVAVLAIAAVVANIALLRSTADTGDPVGRLSPRAVFSGNDSSPTSPVPKGDDRHGSATPDD